jgi:F-type H+-transporting ATPase subunit delta
MRDETIARNYADIYLALAERAGDRAGYGAFLDALAEVVRTDVAVRRFLEAPQVDAAAKNRVLERALGPRAPREIVRFLQALVRNRRQALVADIALAFRALVDRLEGRVQAQVTVARLPDDAGRQALTAQLSRALGKEVVPHFTVKPELLGGVVVKVGDRVLDGSVRRRLALLRGKLVGAGAR